MLESSINVRKLSSLLYKIVIFIPSLVLIGWQFGIEALKTVLPNVVAMNPVTALLFILCGISLYLIKEDSSIKKQQIGKYVGLAVAVIGIIRLTGINFDLALYDLLYRNSLLGDKVAPNTALNFVLTGLSIYLVDFRKKQIYFPSQLLALIAFIIALLALIGYLYAADSLYRFSVYLPMAIHTAVTFLLLTVAIIISRPRCGLANIILSISTGGYLARSFLPLAICIPILVGWLMLKGYRLSLYNEEFGAAIGVIVIILIFSSIIWFTAKSLTKSDQKRKEAEEGLMKAKNDLADNELQYRNLIENAGVVMYTTNFKGEITFASSKAYQLTGYSREELLGMHFSQFIHTECLGDVKASYKNQFQNKIEETQMEFCIRTKKGDLKYVEQSAVLLTENDIPVGFQCIVKDITQRKEMENVVKVYEEKLVENQARLQSILDNATTLIYIKDLEGKYILINKQFKSFLKVTNEEVIGKTDFDYVDHVQAQRFKDSDDEVIKTLKPVELEDVIEMEDGFHNILIIKFPLLDAQNKIYGISGIATDITDRVKYQEHLIEAKKIAEQAQELQEQFLANMSHEIRTPMNGIKGMTDLLLETALNNEQKDFTKTIQRSSDNLLVIINDILDLSKIQAGKLTIEKIDFNLTEILDNIKVLFKYQVAEKGLILQIGVDADVPKVLCGDPYRLNQILVNLIGNAIKFTLSGGVDVKISVQEKRDKEILVSFEITDTGIGIATDKIGKMFDSFTQGSMTTTRKYGGTGLGLSITKRLLELQGGEISVESKVNNGSTFQFTIPYKYSNATSSTVFIDKDSKEYRSLLMGKKFLVVEDNEINQKVVKHVLQQAGGTVEVANHGLEAVAMLQKNSGYDIIIMDLQMPEMDGYAATKYIRSEMKLTNPIIAMTANALKGEREKCLAAGMNDYISKPFDFGYFYKRLSLLVSDKTTVNPIAINEEPCTDGLYDLSLLEEIDDKEYISDILTIFLEETPVDLKALHKACVASDFQRGYQIAHKIKSLSWLIKANCLASPLLKIEEDTKAEKSETLVHLSELAGDEFEKLDKPLRDYLKNLQ